MYQEQAFKNNLLENPTIVFLKPVCVKLVYYWTNGRFLVVKYLSLSPTLFDLYRWCLSLRNFKVPECTQLFNVKQWSSTL